MHNPLGCPGCEKRAKDRYERFQASLRHVLGTNQGREVLDWILDQTGLNAPKLWVPSAELNCVVARRDLGQMLDDEIMSASQTAKFTMQTDRWNRAEAEARLVEEEDSKSKKEKR